ncbi:Uncharacterised protein [Klebsiella michiganensis]|nr:Uncharacterised protein [Klebsiella michiganensis]
MKKHLLGLSLFAALFASGSAVAADYKIDKEGQHAFINFKIKHLGYSWLYGTSKTLTVHLLMMKLTRRLTKSVLKLQRVASILAMLNVISICVVRIS